MAQFSPVFVSLIIVVLYPICRWIYNIWFHPLSKVPGPRLWAASRLPFISHLLRGTMTHKAEALHQIYGPIFRIAPDEVTFAHPDSWTEILQPRPGKPQFLKDPMWWSEPNQLSLINSIDPTSHARKRRTLGPAFTKNALKAQEPIIQQYVSLLVGRLREQVKAGSKANANPNTGGAVVDIFPWMNFTTFDIFGELAFGESFNCLEDSTYHPWISIIFDSIKAIAFVNSVKYYPMFDWLLKKCIPPSMKKKQADHFRLVAEKVDRRVNWEVSREDIMFQTLKESKEGKGMTMDEISFTFSNVAVAGSETTATVLGGILNYLSAEAEVRNRVVAEVRTAFESESDIALIRVEERCKYLTAVIKEGLRLCAPIPWILPRIVSPGGETVCRTWLPGGTIVSIQLHTLHRSPALFHAAAAFRPERWLPSAENPGSPFYNDNRKAVQPFSVGPRACLGKDLAWAEMRLILAHILWVFDVEEKDGGARRWESLRTFILVEKQPLEIRLTEREITSSA